MRRLVSGLVGVAVSVVAANAWAEPPLRRGFTLELGLGGSHMHIDPSRGESHGEFGLAPLSLGIGGFVTPDVAIMARASGTSYFDDRGGETHQFVNNFYGVVAQYWVNDELYLSAGPGVTMFGVNPFLTRSTYTQSAVTGFGLSARAGYSFFTAKHHSLRLAVEVTPSFYDDARVIGSALNLEWQYF